MTKRPFGQRLVFFFIGALLLLQQSLEDLGIELLAFFDDYKEPPEERERRKKDRERRKQRRWNAVSKKLNFRPLVKPAIKETKDWAKIQIDFDKALKKYQSKKQVLVAVIDTGIDFQNKQLTKYLWENTGEIGVDKNGKDKRSNGIDDDGNGFIDDHTAWDFANNDNIAQDTNGHGTHIAGIITQDLNPASDIKIMALQFYSEKNTTKQNIISTAKAIRYAVDNGADIINYSAGGSEASDIEKEALNYAEDNGVLVIAAAGNDNSNNDYRPYYPADYYNKNIISVGSLTQQKRKVASSNFGSKSVDIFAPGKDIESYGLNNRKIKLTGTSQATAFVTKSAAMLMSDKNLINSPFEVKKRILNTAVKTKNLHPFIKEAKVLNAFNVLSQP
jgi:subtilisin family serine protease